MTIDLRSSITTLLLVTAAAACVSPPDDEAPAAAEQQLRGRDAVQLAAADFDSLRAPASAGTTPNPRPTLMTPATVIIFVTFYLTSVNGENLCADDANGVTNGQADVWHCGVNKANIVWNAFNAGARGFELSSLDSGQCLTYLNAGLTNGTPVVMRNCDADDISQYWHWYLLTEPDGTYTFLVPSKAVPIGGQPPSNTPVLSIVGPTATNGSLLQLWRVDANVALQAVDLD
jgi:hypothetical protein